MRAEVFRMGEHQKQVVSWWYAWHGVEINVKLLARFGVAIFDDSDILIAVSHIYPASTADLAWVGFTVRNPSLSYFRAGKALMLLLSETEEAIRRLGYSIAYTGFEPPALQKLCKARGYEAGGQVLEQWKVVR